MDEAPAIESASLERASNGVGDMHVSFEWDFLQLCAKVVGTVRLEWTSLPFIYPTTPAILFRTAGERHRHQM